MKQPRELYRSCPRTRFIALRRVIQAQRWIRSTIPTIAELQDDAVKERMLQLTSLERSLRYLTSKNIWHSKQQHAEQMNRVLITLTEVVTWFQINRLALRAKYQVKRFTAPRARLKSRKLDQPQLFPNAPTTAIVLTPELIAKLSATSSLPCTS
jgi:hypothetical protein